MVAAASAASATGDPAAAAAAAAQTRPARFYRAAPLWRLQCAAFSEPVAVEFAGVDARGRTQVIKECDDKQFVRDGRTVAWVTL